DFPAVAFDGTNYLVAWEDQRSASDLDIFGARVAKTGALRDAAGFAISTTDSLQFNSAIAFDGTNYLVVWQDHRAGTDYDIYGARVTKTGAVLDPGGIPISTAAHDQTGPKLAFDGTNYLVVWGDRRSNNADIYGARVSTNGTVLDPSSIPISTASN